MAAKAATSYPKDKIKVLLLEGLNKSAVDTFEQAGYTNIEKYDKALGEDELIKKLKDVHILGIRSKTQITEKVLKNAPKLLGLGAFCIGTNQIDLDTATKLGIAVFNSPYSNTRSVAELVIGESIMLIRRLPDKDRAAHQGNWQKDAKGSHELRGKTLGIIGYGHIGSQVSVLSESMGLKVIYYDVEPKLPLGNAEPVDSMDKLLKRADIVSLHVPGIPTTVNLLNEEKIQKIKKGAILLNLSRGNVVDLDAARKALDSGRLSGMGVDVFPVEPKQKGEGFVSPLQGAPNTILTPHIGGSTEEAQVNIGFDVAGKLVNWLDNGSTVGSLTVPALNLPIQLDTNRFLHIHANQPGVLSELNSIVGKMNVNIVGQYLKTTEDIGYVVLDTQKKDPKDLLKALDKAKHTIRTRILY